MSTTIENTTAPAPTCCYALCDRVATELDDDGDLCCERCYWQVARQARFVEIRRFDSDFTWRTARCYERLMAKRGWRVTVREPVLGRCEAEGTYVKEPPHWELQILGYSVRPPQSYEDDSRSAHEAILRARSSR